MNRGIVVSFVDAERIAMDHHYTHVKAEVETLKVEIESDDITPEELSEKKKKLKKLNDDLMKRGAVMEVMNIDTKKTDELKKFADDVYHKAEAKQLDVSNDKAEEQSESGCKCSIL